MTCPPRSHPRELARLRALRSLHLLDTEPEERFDRLTRIGAQLLGFDYCLISLIDANRQWFKSDYGGIGCSQTERGISFCGHTILQQEGLLLIENASEHDWFRENPLVTGQPHIATHLGITLYATDGLPIGTLCGINSSVKVPSQAQIAAFTDLARCAESEIIGIQDACTDPLTNLPNRRGFFRFASSLKDLANAQNLELGFTYIDINNLKQINDEQGHHMGDQAIETLGKAILASIRSHSGCDLPVRLSGDEFGILILSQQPRRASAAVIQRIRAELRNHPLRSTAERERQTVSFEHGLSLTGPELPRQRGIDSLIQAAESAMRHNKRRRKHQENALHQLMQGSSPGDG